MKLFILTMLALLMIGRVHAGVALCTAEGPNGDGKFLDAWCMTDPSKNAQQIKALVEQKVQEYIDTEQGGRPGWKPKTWITDDRMGIVVYAEAESTPPERRHRFYAAFIPSTRDASQARDDATLAFGRMYRGVRITSIDSFICSETSARAAAAVAAPSGNLQVYCWQGKGTGSNLLNPAFTKKWLSSLNDGAGARVTVELFPSPERILDMLGKSNIVFASTHSGLPKGADYQALQVGDKGSGRYVLKASEIAAIRASKPQLVVVNGCNTIPLLPESGGAVRNIATAFGISAATKGRAYVGFQKEHDGAKGDDFFRVFFYFWSGVGSSEKRLTLREAADKAQAFIEEQVTRMGGDKAETFFLSNAAASLRKDLEIIGDDRLLFTDIRP